MEIRELTELDQDLLKSFYSANTHLIYHTLEYKKFIEDAFATKYLLLGVIVDSAVQLLLPIVEVKSNIFGNKVISSAYLEYGGFAGEEKYIPEILVYLREKYAAGNDYLEIRGGIDSFDSVLSTQLIKKDLYKRFVLNLSDGEEAVWKNVQESKRKAVKKALKVLEVKDVPVSEIDELYQLYCRNMRSFGSPPYSKQYFRSFYEYLVSRGLGKIYGSYYQGGLVSALLGLCYGDRVHIIIAISDEEHLELRPNDAMHWEFIKWACVNKYKWFDFGRVREASGQFEYKQKWGPTLMELPSYFHLWKAKEVPLVDPSGHKLAVKVWKRMPLWFTRMLGMRLRKGLGI